MAFYDKSDDGFQQKRSLGTYIESLTSSSPSKQIPVMISDTRIKTLIRLEITVNIKVVRVAYLSIQYHLISHLYNTFITNSVNMTYFGLIFIQAKVP